MARTKFTLPPVGQPGPITVDGNRIPGVTGYTLTNNVGDIPKLELEMSVLTDEPIAGEARVYITERAREGLLALGWTPPEDDSATA